LLSGGLIVILLIPFFKNRLIGELPKESPKSAPTARPAAARA